MLKNGYSRAASSTVSSAVTVLCPGWKLNVIVNRRIGYKYLAYTLCIQMHLSPTIMEVHAATVDRLVVSVLLLDFCSYVALHLHNIVDYFENWKYRMTCMLYNKEIALYVTV